MMAKVCKEDGEGTFAGTRENDKVAPIADLPALTPERASSDPKATSARAPVRTKKRTVRPFAVVVASAAAMGFVDCAVIGLLSRLASTLAPVRCESISLLLGATLAVIKNF
jgi:hypothetical protein